jgi:hypothetical protein
MTATLVEDIRNPDRSTSFCCGSTRVLPRGNWVAGWGGTPESTEVRSDGTRVFRLVAGNNVYRTLPLLPGQYSASQFRTGMDVQYGAN